MRNFNNKKKELFLKRMIPFAIIITFCVTLSFVADSLIHPIYDQRKISNVIVILGGDEGRLHKGVQLYKQGYAKKILLSPTSKNFSREDAIKLGVKPTDIIVENKSTSTFNTVKNVNIIMNYYKFNSAIIVTSDYHMKRTIFSFNKEKSDKYNVFYVSAFDTQGKKWYQRRNSLEIWFSEFKKLTGYRLHLYKFIDE